MIIPSENQALAEFYVEIVAALLKCYMLLQMTYMVQTVNNLGKKKNDFGLGISIQI